MPRLRVRLQPAMAAPAKAKQTTIMIAYGTQERFWRRWLPVSVCRTRRAATTSTTRPMPTSRDPATPKATKRPRFLTGSTVSCLA